MRGCMRFDWRRFCETNGIEYKENTAGTAKGNIYIDCPLCGAAGIDKAHMGLSVNDSRWGCWKSKGHAGRRPRYLIANLLRCDLDTAASYESDQDWVSDEWAELEAAAALLDAREPIDDPRRGFKAWPLPRDLFPLRDHDTKSRTFLEYIAGRGFKRPDDFAARYSMYGALGGEFRYRVVAPIFRKGIIIGATGRHIGSHKQRYHTQPSDVTNRTIYNYDAAATMEPGGTLVLCEGPWDALKLDWYFERKQLAACAVALAGLGYDGNKRREVADLVRDNAIRRVIVLLDRGEEAKALGVVTDLEAVGVPADLGTVPHGLKDPGEMRAGHIRRLLGT